MKQKQSFLLPLLMAIVMMAMSPTKGWADDTQSSVPTQVTITATPNDSRLGTVTGGGTYEYSATEKVTLTATPSECCGFEKWSDGETTETREVPRTGDLTLTAEFKQVEPYHNEIWYTTTDGKAITTSVLTDMGLTSNTYDSANSRYVMTFTQNLTSIAISAFKDCSTLQTFTIPSTVTVINENAFQDCAALQSITIPSGVQTIGGSAFANCCDVKSITIPESVGTIGSQAFENCAVISSGLSNNSNTTNDMLKDSGLLICDAEQADGLLTKDNSAVFCRKSATIVTITANITSIENGAFKKCTRLQSITIPNSVETIGSVAFNECTSLQSINIPSSVISIGDYAFASCSNLTDITLPSSVTLTDGVFGDTNGNTVVKIVFADNDALAQYVKEGAKQFYENGLDGRTHKLFMGATEITSLSIPSGVTSIIDHAFRFCSSLTSVTIPDGVTSIGKTAFASCDNLSTITIPNSVTTIRENAFDNCWYNNQPDGMVYAGKVAYKYKGTMPANTSIVLNEDTKGIAEEAFKDCLSLTSITIPSSVTSIGAKAFYCCSGLTSVFCKGSTPATLGDEVFNYYSNGQNPILSNLKTICVPTDSEAAYKTAAGWSNYADIINKHDYANGFCTVCGAYQPLGEADEDGWYNISNPRQLKDFSDKVNSKSSGEYKARLTRDIDMQGITGYDPIYYVPQMTFLYSDNNFSPDGFKGTFDGQGHVISNLTITPYQYRISIGLFGNNKGTICNLGLRNFYYNNNGDFDGRFAAIAGVNLGTIKNCYVVQSQVSSSNHVCGAIAGGNYGGTIENCYEFGNQIENNSRCGHLVGDANNDNKSLVGIIKNCYSDGKLGNENQSKYPGGGQTGEAKLQATRFNSGYVAYMLNGGENGKTDGTQAWYQNIKMDEEDEDFDSHPVLKSTGSNTVYCTYGETCTDQTFNNNGGSGTPNHEYDIAWSWAEDGKTAKAIHTCHRNNNHVVETVATVTSQQTLAPTCGAKGETTYTASVNVIGTEQTDTNTLADIPATGNHVVPDNYDAYGYKYCSSCQNNIPMPLGDADANGWYSLSNAAQLTLFANKVNAGETSIKGRLANDIDMQGQTVVQIGADSNVPFHGELDGQYHAIKNLSISADAEYKASLIGHADKVTIQKLTVQGTINSSSKFATGFIGQTKNEPSKIQKCISAVDIIATIAGDGTHAGFVGVASAKVELSDCAFVGSITSESGTTNCAALVGWDSSKSSSAQNCYVTAAFTNGICQNQLMRNRSDDFPTCYYLNDFLNADGTPLTSVQGNQFTAQQFANGELCYLLNGGVNYKTDGTQAWYQKIGTDDSPVLKAAEDGSNTVYYGYNCRESNETYANHLLNAEANMPYTDANTDGYCDVCGEGVDVTLTLSKVGDRYYTSFGAPYIYNVKDASENIKVYVATSSLSEGVLTMTQVGAYAIPADKGVVIVGTSSSSPETMTATIAHAEDAIDVDDHLGATTAGMDPTGKLFFSVVNGIVGFYAYNTTLGDVPAGKAYLPAPSSDDAKGFTMVFDDETDGIDEVSSFKSQVSGKYLENGKVVIVRNGKKFNVNGQEVK